MTLLGNPVRFRFDGATSTPRAARLTYANSVSSQESYGASELDRYCRVFQSAYPLGIVYWGGVLATLCGNSPAEYLKTSNVRRGQLARGMASVWLSDNTIQELGHADRGWAVNTIDLAGVVEDDFGIPLKFRVGTKQIRTSVRVELSESRMGALRVVQPRIPRLRIGPDEEL